MVTSSNLGTGSVIKQIGSHGSITPSEVSQLYISFVMEGSGEDKVRYKGGKEDGKRAKLKESL